MHNFNHIIVDGNYWARRLFATNKHLYHTVDGETIQTGLTHGFFTGLLALKRTYKGNIIVVWDRGHDRRKAIDNTYKENRKKIQTEWVDREWFNNHLKILLYFLKIAGIKQAYKQGEEGDDILYSLSLHLKGNKLLVTNDHDLNQAISKNTSQLVNKGGQESIWTEDRFIRVNNVTPRLYSYMMALSGCSGDGIPGVKGVGETTAFKVVKALPHLVSVISGKIDAPLTDFAPRLDKFGNVAVTTIAFKRGENYSDKIGKRIQNALDKILEDPHIVYNTYRLTRLYDVWPVVMKQCKPDYDNLEMQLERAALHELSNRLDEIKELN
jgi:5'-3' exonuclease